MKASNHYWTGKFDPYITIKKWFILKIFKVTIGYKLERISVSTIFMLHILNYIYSECSILQLYISLPILSQKAPNFIFIFLFPLFSYQPNSLLNTNPIISNIQFTTNPNNSLNLKSIDTNIAFHSLKPMHQI